MVQLSYLSIYAWMNLCQELLRHKFIDVYCGTINNSKDMLLAFQWMYR